MTATNDGTSTSGPSLGVPIGRIPVSNVSPVIEGGAYAAKAAPGELIPVRATVFREGHDAVNASIVTTDPDGNERLWPMHPTTPLGFDWWTGTFSADRVGAWTFRVEGWSDPWETWIHTAEIKIPAGIDTHLVVAEGRTLFGGAAERADQAGDGQAASELRAAADLLGEGQGQLEDRLHAVLAPRIRSLMYTYGPRDLLSPTPDYPVFVDRKAALFSSWYEFFPRSEGARWDEDNQRWISGTFDSSHSRLEAAAGMGFDVVYVPPIHPIGRSFRKGANNTLNPGPHDPGSPWAIGAAEGGHDAIHPDLGDFDAFDRFVAKAKELGMEIALDLALNASPDHPWVTEHPEWFAKRADGSIAYAENPPKKYQDIYNFSFDSDRAIYDAWLEIVRLWMSHGVRIFRVDNPHTKPVEFWAWLLAEVRKTDPDVLFLAEAFTKPAMMHMLGKVGFQQSYTYFTWRNEKWEIEQYMKELTEEMAPFYRPNFFVNTPDILPSFLQWGGKTAFTIRAVLAATLSPIWGVYAGFELFENTPIGPGREEYIDSEKFQYRPRDWAAAEESGESLSLLIGRLNEIRREHPALQQLRNITFHHAPHSHALIFSKRAPNPNGGPDDVVIVVSSLDPHNVVETELFLDVEALGLSSRDVYLVHDEITGQTWRWGAHAFVRLTHDDPAHVLTIVRYNPNSRRSVGGAQGN